MSETLGGASQCPLEHCMLSDYRPHNTSFTCAALSLNALSSIVCFLTSLGPLFTLAGIIVLSQCPLEHCMLSDEPWSRKGKAVTAKTGLNALSSIVCFLTTQEG